jgi:hypothetical protein
MVVNNAALIKGVFKVRKISIRVNKKPNELDDCFQLRNGEAENFFDDAECGDG